MPAIVHQPHGHIFYGYYGRAVTGFYVALERIAARWSDRLITLTDHEIDEHLALGIGRRAQFVTVPSGVPTAELRARAPQRAAARDALGLPPDAFVVDDDADREPLPLDNDQFTVWPVSATMLPLPSTSCALTATLLPAAGLVVEAITT